MPLLSVATIKDLGSVPSSPFFQLSRCFEKIFRPEKHQERVCFQRDVTMSLLRKYSSFFFFAVCAGWPTLLKSTGCHLGLWVLASSYSHVAPSRDLFASYIVITYIHTYIIYTHFHTTKKRFLLNVDILLCSSSREQNKPFICWVSCSFFLAMQKLCSALIKQPPLQSIWL